MKPIKFFGASLEKTVEQENKLVPSLFKEIIRSLNNEQHLKSDLLFRKMPSTQVINEWKAKIESGIQIDYKQLDRDVSFGILKTWLRELPQPVATFELYDEWVAVSETTDITKICELLDQLPQTYFFVLEIFFLFLGRVSEFTSFNNMSTVDLGLLFAQCIFRPKEETLDTILHGTKLASLTTFLIDNYAKLFKTRDFSTIKKSVSPVRSASNTALIINIKMTVSKAIEELKLRLEEEKDKLMKCETPEESSEIVRLIHNVKVLLANKKK